jgi:hypothetical protein
MMSRIRSSAAATAITQHQSIDSSHQRLAQQYVRRIIDTEPDVRRRVLGPHISSRAIDDVFELAEQFTNDDDVKRAFMKKWNKICRARVGEEDEEKRCLQLEMENQWVGVGFDDDELELEFEQEPGADEEEDDVFQWIKHWISKWGVWFVNLFDFNHAQEQEIDGPGYSPYRNVNQQQTTRKKLNALVEAAGITSVLVMMTAVMIKMSR